ncbi:hypothetical protein TNCV_851281 [Trichonephila clavipes]|nr:hypothetical protein TNCV_851281 [Trichonephila clavipes]
MPPSQYGGYDPRLVTEWAWYEVLSFCITPRNWDASLNIQRTVRRPDTTPLEKEIKTRVKLRGHDEPCCRQKIQDEYYANTVPSADPGLTDILPFSALLQDIGLNSSGQLGRGKTELMRMSSRLKCFTLYRPYSFFYISFPMFAC